MCLRNLVEKLLPHAHRLDAEASWEQIALHVVDDWGMQAAHLAFFGKDTTTDVISQRYAPFPGERGSMGEIIVNTQQAVRASATARWSWQKELALYVAHGLDHLHGGLDDTHIQQQQMRRRELRWLRQIEKQGFAFESLLSSPPNKSLPAAPTPQSP